MDLNLSHSKELEFLNTMAYDVSTTGRGFVKSLHELGQSSAIMKTDYTFGFQAHKTKQTSSQRHKGKAGPAGKQISSAQATACPLNGLSLQERLCVSIKYNYGLQIY